MDSLKNNNGKDINSILAAIKFGALLFGLVVISYQIIIRNHLSSIFEMKPILIMTFEILLPLMLIIYLSWSYFHINKKYDNNNKTILVLENFVFIVFFSTLNILADSYESDFKFLFLFVIIPSSIQLGSRFGIIIASVSSTIILTIDLIFAPSRAINFHFQNDLILAAALLLVAWALGNYVEIQKENISKKDEQLNLLNIKLTEQELQRKYIENMIINNEVCYNMLINNSNNAIFIHRDSKLIFSNESAAELIGMQLTALIDKSILDFVPDDEKANIADKYNSIYQNSTSIISFEQKLIGMNSTEAAVRNISTCFIYEGKPTILTILHDITSEKQVELLQKDVQKNIELLNETREFNRFITEFFSNISHELKTPLNIIFSTLQLLDFQSKNNQENLIQNKDKYLAIMKQNCFRLTRLINNLLDITRADSGFLLPHMKNYNIISVVEDITMSVTSFAESKGISLIFDTDCEEKIMAFDPDKIERIVLNLLSNSIKFTNNGGEILVTMQDEEDYISLSVKDTGIGIPEDKLNIIFQRFRQVDRSFTRNHEGSGIGLSLVKSFVEMHNGTIEATSELGQGSEFIIRLPASLCGENYLDEKYIDHSIIQRINIEFSDIYS
jgi:PAS domain S-box-containing protein